MKVNKVKLGTILDYLIVSIWAVIGTFCCVKAAMAKELIPTSIYIGIAAISFYFTANCITRNIYRSVIRSCFYEDEEEMKD